VKWVKGQGGYYYRYQDVRLKIDGHGPEDGDAYTYILSQWTPTGWIEVQKSSVDISARQTLYDLAEYLFGPDAVVGHLELLMEDQ